MQEKVSNRKQPERNTPRNVFRRWRLVPGRVPRMMILGNLPGHRPKREGKPQEDSKEIL
jgi:hypothetical protein